MDSVCKLVSKILQQRLDKILIEHGLECQNGFMGGRGTTDGISILYQALLKRREHQQAQIPPFGCNNEDADTSVIYADEGNGIARFTKKFKYLGFLLTPELTSTAEADKRLASSAAFGALRKTVFSSKNILYTVKAKIHNALILSKLIYSSET